MMIIFLSDLTIFINFSIRGRGDLDSYVEANKYSNATTKYIAINKCKMTKPLL